MSLSRWYKYISPHPSWYYGKEGFTCGTSENDYLTGIEITNDYAGSNITSIKFTCSNGREKEFANRSTNGSYFHGPKVYTYTVPTGISSLTIGEGENQVGLIIPSIDLTDGYTHVETFSCPTGSFINDVEVLIPYANKNLTGRYDYIGGFQFGCTTPPSTQQSHSQSKTTTTKDSSSSNSVGLIVGLIIVFLVIIGIAVGGYYYYRYRKKKNAEKSS